MEQTRDKEFYCYNLKQAAFFKHNGIREIDFDISNINNKAYFLFERNDKLEEVFILWNSNKIN